ncbi:MAG: hypothetical protein AAF773_25490 [Cyanobacteria bacterium P01_D01_bin.115]
MHFAPFARWLTVADNLNGGCPVSRNPPLPDAVACGNNPLQ